VDKSILYAIGAAVLFGASTPLAKLLVGDVSPVLLGGLLYLGSGVGLGLVRIVRDKGWSAPGIGKGEWPWLLGAVVFGGILGPVALMYGLTMASGSAASLMLNLESVLTAVLAWVAFKENADKRIVLGMVCIVAGGAVLSWSGSASGTSSLLGLGAIALACLCWAIDNNLTRKVSASDSVFIASFKGLLAGIVNCTIAFSFGAVLPGAQVTALAMAVGLLGYGISLVLFVLALRGLGAARTGAYFSTAPFVGALVSLLLLGESANTAFWLACALMAMGVWLHLTEHHEHEHDHAPQEHSHAHTHDEHHQHAHEAGVDVAEPHVHWHRHEATRHTHAHYPDIHHQHSH
jgi:drug/metabolite transporter (DMT)-like permease